MTNKFKPWSKPLSGVYASSLVLHPSAWRRWSFRAGILIVLLQLLFLPLTGWALMVAALAVLALVYALLQEQQQVWSVLQLNVTTAGALRWHDDALPAGQLLPQSRVCALGVLLVWRDEHTKIQRVWLFQDHFSTHDFRALARHCALVRMSA